MEQLSKLGLRTQVDCGSFKFTRERILAFANEYDRQPFHLDDAAAESGLFGRLTASGIHVSSACRGMVLRGVMRDAAYLGSPGSRQMRMFKPVFVDMVLRVTHRFSEPSRLENYPGVAVVEGLTEAHDESGALVMRNHDLNWIALEGRVYEEEAASLRDRLAADPSASVALGSLESRSSITPEEGPASQDRIYFEDCPVGFAARSMPRTMDPERVEAYRVDFGSGADDAAIAERLRNDWIGVAASIRLMADSFWLRTTTIGGSGVDNVRFPNPIQGGDTLRGEIRIVAARPLSTRPGVGMVKANCVSVNQRDEVVASFDVTTFLRQRI